MNATTRGMRTSLRDQVGLGGVCADVDGRGHVRKAVAARHGLRPALVGEQVWNADELAPHRFEEGDARSRGVPHRRAHLVSLRHQEQAHVPATRGTFQTLVAF